MGFQPGVHLILRQALDVLGRIGGLGTAAEVQKIQSLGRLIQRLLIACGVAKGADGVLFDQGGRFGVILPLTNDLFHVQTVRFPRIYLLGFE